MMARAYTNFPPNCPTVNGRPIGVCACGRWADDSSPVQICLNAPATAAPPSRDFDTGFHLGVTFASNRQRQNTDKTPSRYAAGVRRSLGRRRCVQFVDDVGPSFLTAAESEGARNSISEDKHERHLVAYMTPLFLQRLMPSLPNHFVLVNSEEYPWIPQKEAFLHNNDIAPHHFVAPHYLVQFLHPNENALNSNGEYGTFPVFTARQSLAAVGDAKKNLDDQGEGEFMNVLESISFSSIGEVIEARGFVYDWEKCSLMTAINGRVIQITTVKWVTPGSHALICNYFQDNQRIWHGCLEVACIGMGISLPRYSTLDGNYGQCVLGEGGSGRVFEVLRDGQHLALKLVMGEEDCEELSTEFELIGNFPVEVQSRVVSVVAGSLWRGSLDRQYQDSLPVAAFLMSTIGIPFMCREEVTDEYGRLILEALSDIHAAHICHGDARYKNVVRLEHAPKRVEVRWIDFALSSITSAPVRLVWDLTVFFQSINRSFNKEAADKYAFATFCNTWVNMEERRSAAKALWI